MVIFGVNMTTEPIKATFDFGGFNQRITEAEGVCDLLDARQPDVMNHWNVAERVSVRHMQTARNEVVFPPLSAVAVECAAF